MAAGRGGRQKKGPGLWLRAWVWGLAIPYFRTANCRTIIGARRFHFRVRDGSGWGTPAMVTKQIGALDRPRRMATRRKASLPPLAGRSVPCPVRSVLCAGRPCRPAVYRSARQGAGTRLALQACRAGAGYFACRPAPLARRLETCTLCSLALALQKLGQSGRRFFSCLTVIRLLYPVF